MLQMARLFGEFETAADGIINFEGDVATTISTKDVAKLWNIKDGTLIATVPGLNEAVRQNTLVNGTCVVVLNQPSETLKVWHQNVGSTLEELARVYHPQIGNYYQTKNEAVLKTYLALLWKNKSYAEIFCELKCKLKGKTLQFYSNHPFLAQSLLLLIAFGAGRGSMLMCRKSSLKFVSSTPISAAIGLLVMQILMRPLFLFNRK